MLQYLSLLHQLLLVYQLLLFLLLILLAPHFKLLIDQVNILFLFFSSFLFIIIGLSSGAIAGITISIFILLVVFIILIIIIIILQYLHIRKSNDSNFYCYFINLFISESAGKKEVTVLGNISSIPSVSNEAYAAVDSIVNVQENVAYSLPQRHTIAAANPPTAALYETINI